MRKTKEEVHRNMAAIRSKDTRPELVVRRYLWRQGFRYRLNDPRLPGHPDIVLRKYRTCVFVNGCFWHGHAGCRHFRMPDTHKEYWEQKIRRNQERDSEEQRQLARMGWHCVTVWECELKPKVREHTLEALAFTLNRIFLDDHQLAATHRAATYRLPEEQQDMGIAAEPEPATRQQAAKLNSTPKST